MELLPGLPVEQTCAVQIEAVINIAAICAAAPLSDKLILAQFAEVVGDYIQRTVDLLYQFVYAEVALCKERKQLPTNIVPNQPKKL